MLARVLGAVQKNTDLLNELGAVGVPQVVDVVSVVKDVLRSGRNVQSSTDYIQNVDRFFRYTLKALGKKSTIQLPK